MVLKAVVHALGQMPQALKTRLAGLTDAQLRAKTRGDMFSLLENVCHLRDIEIDGYSARLKRILHETHPTLPDLDGGKLALERRYSEQPLQPALDAFLKARSENLQLLGTLTAAQLKRGAFLETVGEITLGKLLELWVEHDRGHIKEVDETLLALREPRAGHKPKPSLSLGSL